MAKKSAKSAKGAKKKAAKKTARKTAAKKGARKSAVWVPLERLTSGAIPMYPPELLTLLRVMPS